MHFFRLNTLAAAALFCFHSGTAAAGDADMIGRRVQDVVRLVPGAHFEVALAPPSAFRDAIDDGAPDTPARKSIVAVRETKSGRCWTLTYFTADSYGFVESISAAAPYQSAEERKCALGAVRHLWTSWGEPGSYPLRTERLWVIAEDLPGHVTGSGSITLTLDTVQGRQSGIFRDLVGGP